MNGNEAELSIEAIYSAAIELADHERRAAYLDEACGQNTDLRQRVERLIDAHSDRGSFLESPAPSPTIAYESRNPEGPGEIIGPYKLLERIGEGGMGVVYRAEQIEPVRRQVALKLIKPGMDTRQVLARFDAERQALAMMDHPNIARILDAGADAAGRPFFVMELVRGLPITRYCDEARMPIRRRLELFALVCQAVQHAHQKGIIHRDIKPTNVLVTLHDGAPVPKVIDFGVAKALGPPLVEGATRTGFLQMIGTPLYMSPEQAGLSEDIDTRADIYSLGVLLYELLTGVTPFDREQLRLAAYEEVRRIIREVEPPTPSSRLTARPVSLRSASSPTMGEGTVEERAVPQPADTLPSAAALRDTEPARLTKTLRGELDWIVMKCLDKDRRRRYETANALALDVRRYLADEPVAAGPPSAWYRFRKGARRHRAALTTAAVVAIALVTGTTVATWQALEARRARAEVVVQRERAEKREQMAIDAVKRFRDAVVDEPVLKNSLDLQELRKRLLKEPLAFFHGLRERLQADRDTRPEVLVRLAEAIHDYAHLTDEIGDADDGLKAHEDSLAIWEIVVRRNPKNAKHQLGLAQIENCRGNFLKSAGKSEQARAAYDRACEIQGRLVQENPSVTVYAYALALTHNNIGILLRATGDLTGAQAAYERARSIQERLVRVNPSVSEYAHHLARMRVHLARLLSETDDADGARTMFEEAWVIQERLARENPSNREYALDLAQSHGDRGVLLLATGDVATALAAVEQSRAILERLVQENPGVSEYARDLAQTYFGIGVLLRATGDPTGAQAVYERAQAIQEQLVRKNPSVTEYAQDLARTYNNLGILLRATGDPTGARAAFEQTRAISERLVWKNPESPSDVINLGAALNNLATLDLDLQDFGKARDQLQAGIVRLKQALAANPQNSTYRQLLDNYYTNLAKAARGLNDSDLASEAESGLAELRATDPRSAVLEERLNAVIGGAAPKNNFERLVLAQHAYDIQKYSLAVRIWREAIESDRAIAADREAQHRYNAACAAVLAATGQGCDEPAPDNEARLKLRHQALTYLRAELETWTRLLKTANDNQRTLIAQTLNHWCHVDPDLAPVRDDAELGKLPDAEREAFRALWTDARVLLDRARNPGSPRERPAPPVDSTADMPNGPDAFAHTGQAPTHHAP